MRDRKARGMTKSTRGRTLPFPKGALTHHSPCEWWTTDKVGGVPLRGRALCEAISTFERTRYMSETNYEFENQEFLKARYEDKTWYTVRKHVCPECGKEYYTICNFRKYCSDACCAVAKEKRVVERKQAHRSEHICEVCGKAFSSKRTDARYCTNACRQKAYRQGER